MILLLLLFSPWQTYSLCVPENVCRSQVSAGVFSSLTLVALLSVKSLMVIHLRNKSLISWFLSNGTVANTTIQVEMTANPVIQFTNTGLNLISRCMTMVTKQAGRKPGMALRVRSYLDQLRGSRNAEFTDQSFFTAELQKQCLYLLTNDHIPPLPWPPWWFCPSCAQAWKYRIRQY